MSTKGMGRPDVAVDAIEDAFLRRSVKGALHLRRYMPFYVFGVIWIITLAAFPSIRGGDDDSGDVAATGIPSAQNETGAIGETTAEVTADTTAVVDDGSTSAGATASAPTTPGAPAPGAARPAAGAAAGPAAAGGPANEQPAADALQRGTGKTRLGIDCTPDVRQVPGSSYATTCQNVYDGPNGGATYRGVTDKEITIVYRKFPSSPNQRAVDEVNSQAGFASREVIEATRQEFVKFFNKSYELYGRQVKYIVYESKNGDSTAEAQSKGKEGACLDADEIVKEIKAFAVLQGTSPFSECAAERKMPVWAAAAYFPETFFRKYHPYLWNTVMECERISYQVAEYIGKRLLKKPARWAGDPVLQRKERYIGIYVPDNDAYQSCVNITKRELKGKYGLEKNEQYNYQLDVSRFPDQAAAASVQFASAGVTSVLLACDYISTTVLTAAAEQQGWRPEWLNIGVAANDTDNAARLFNQRQVNGHLFGLSQLGETTKLLGKNSEPGRVYKAATGKDIPDGTTGDYFNLTMLFNMLQAAGPNLTPEALGRGAPTIPPGGAPEFPYGYWSLADGPDGKAGATDHTTTDDSREVFWVADPNVSTEAGRPSPDPYFNGPDGKNGTFKETYGGKRFRNSEWVAEDPPIYPAR